MLDQLKRMKPRANETGIINLDSSRGSGTHWVAYHKRGGPVSSVFYFDSFGLRPPPEVIKYFHGSGIFFSNDKVQNYNQTNCGKLSLEFLIKTVV